MRIAFRPVEPEDAERLSALAATIWRQYYPAIISTAQIEYMLAQRYEPQLIRAELKRQDVWWDKLVVDGEMVGFVSCFLGEAPGEMKLDKLYVREDQRRKGCGAAMVAQVCERARRAGCTRVVLAVNRNNCAAIAAYRKYGFCVRGAQVKPIGGGFVMDDCIMEKALE